MSNYLVTDTELTQTAAALRTKGGTSEQIEWGSGTGFKSAIEALPSGGGSVHNYIKSFDGITPYPTDYGFNYDKCHRYSANDTSSNTTLSLSVSAFEGDWILATVTTRSATTYPSDWALLHESHDLGSGGVNQRMAMLCKQATRTGVVSISVSQASSERIYLNLIAFTGINGFSYTSGTEEYSLTAINSITRNKSTNSRVVWCHTATTWKQDGSYHWTCSADLERVDMLSSSQSRQSNFIDDLPQGSRVFYVAAGETYSQLVSDYVTILED